MRTVWQFSQGSTYVHSNFTWTWSSSINHSYNQNTRDTRLLDGEDRIHLRSLVLTEYRSVTGGRICRITYNTYKANFAARCKNYCSNVSGVHGCILGLTQYRIRFAVVLFHIRLMCYLML